MIGAEEIHAGGIKMKCANSLLIAIAGAAAILLASCATTAGGAEDFSTVQGATLKEGPKGILFTAQGGNAMALRLVKPYTKQLRCELSLQAAPSDDVMNGFLFLGSRQAPESMILSGVYIGARQYAIEGLGLERPIRVPGDFSDDEVFNISVLVDLEKGFVEMNINGHEIGTRLVSHLKQIDMIGYHAKSTATYFSRIELSGR